MEKGRLHLTNISSICIPWRHLIVETVRSHPFFMPCQSNFFFVSYWSPFRENIFKKSKNHHLQCIQKPWLVWYIQWTNWNRKINLSRPQLTLRYAFSSAFQRETLQKDQKFHVLYLFNIPKQRKLLNWKIVICSRKGRRPVYTSQVGDLFRVPSAKYSVQ